jgi:hypothetical protein
MASIPNKGNLVEGSYAFRARVIRPVSDTVAQLKDQAPGMLPSGQQQLTLGHSG